MQKWKSRKLFSFSFSLAFWAWNATASKAYARCYLWNQFLQMVACGRPVGAVSFTLLASFTIEKRNNKKMIGGRYKSGALAWGP